MASNLERGVGALKKFQSQINTLLSEFEGGAGGNGEIAAQRVPRSSFSGPGKFDEAEGFSMQYERVHTSLIALSKSLGDQIELLSIGVHAADVGYDNVEEDLRYRFHSIQTRLDEQREEQAKQQRQDRGEAPEAPRQNETGGTKDLG
ncbi:hypothetical protein SSPS47_25780 [Streptomyces sp. S4.7]|uniref:hypothetical protein n=1 Tax=unclassified Streptomyces TaxID=2593676 RepID=UPI0011C829F8|nr:MULTISPECIES: hypothetical protein [unclassified Streptomyces]QHY98525.1 hypothetical protein SSPS47_25780 [Streptomyces sp. S4.7]TXL84103.1 hypothetical protein EW053_35390 [Streptomyces sp. IB2014 016-6]